MSLVRRDFIRMTGLTAALLAVNQKFKMNPFGLSRAEAREAGAATDTKWNISGTYFEACNCDVACPCVFLSEPTGKSCDALVGWQIEKGNYGKVRLKGLNVALYIDGAPGAMTGGNWKIALYIDKRANKKQTEALTKIYAGQAGGFFGAIAPLIGEVLGVKNVPIKYQANGRTRSLSIPNVADMEIEAIEGQGGAEVTINNNPLTLVPGQTVVVAKSKRVTYNDYGHKLEVSGKSGFYSPFVYQG